MIITHTTKMRKLIVMLCALLMIYSVACIQEGNYKTPELCKNNWKANISLADLQSFYKGETKHVWQEA